MIIIPSKLSPRGLFSLPIWPANPRVMVLAAQSSLNVKCSHLQHLQAVRHVQTSRHAWLLGHAQLNKTAPARVVRALCVPEARNKLRHNTQPLQAGEAYTPAVAYNEVHLTTKTGITVHDITPDVEDFLSKLVHPCGTLTVTSKHTTVAITVNEFEPRLVEDLRLWLSRQAPANEVYLHNDVDQRAAPEGWPGGWEAWAAQEPLNAHSHLLAVLTGASVSVPVVDGALQLGAWQRVLLVELDGPRDRAAGLQFSGLTAAAR